MRNKTLHKQVTLLATCALISSSAAVTPVFAADYEKHWASASIEKWSSKGIVEGYTDGTFRPNSNITRGELATILTRIFGLNANSGKTYTDVAEDAWYANAIAQVSGLGIMNDYGNKFAPNKFATREETAYAIATAYKVSQNENQKEFVDSSSISDWAEDEVHALASYNYIQGRPDNTFDPTANVTRAELVRMIDNITCELFNVAGTYTKDVNGNAIISAKDITLEGIKINGDLHIAQGVGEGDVTLRNVEVTGTIFVNGGGENSIHFENTDAHTVKVNKVTGKVRIETKGCAIKNIEISSPTKLDGKFTNVNVNQAVTVELSKATIIQVLEAINSVEVKGQGIIKEAILEGKVTFDKKPDKVTGGTVQTTPSGNGGGGGGSSSSNSSGSNNNNNNTPDDDSSPTYATAEQIKAAKLELETYSAVLVDEKFYTEESWEIFARAYTSLKDFANAERIEAAKLDTARTVAKEAFENLKFILATKENVELCEKHLINTYGIFITDKDLYEATGWSKFEAAYNELKSICENIKAESGITCKDLSTLLNKVEDTSKELVKVVVPPTDLEIVFPNLEAFEALNELDYTPETWEVFATKLEAVKALKDKENLTAEELGKAMQELIDAKGALVKATTQVKPSIPNLDEFESLNELDYSAESWEVFANALAQVKEIIAAEDFDVMELGQAMQALVEAKNNLEKTASDVVVAIPDLSEFKALVAEGYTEESWAIFADALEAVEQLIASDEIDGIELDQAMQALIEAKNNLAKVPSQSVVVVPDLSEFKALVEEDYTEETWEVFANALAQVEQIIEAGDFDARELGEAMRLLIEAKDALVKTSEVTPGTEVTPVKPNLAIFEAAKEEEFTAETWGPFADALQVVKDIIAEDTFDVTELGQAMQVLLAAYENLEYVSVDSTPVVPTFPNLDAFDALVEDEYTSESWEVFTNALEAVKALADKEDLTAQELAEAMEALVSAKENLVKVENTETSVPVTPVVPNRPNLSQFETLIEEDYTAETWAPFNTALQAVKDLCDQDEFTSVQLLEVLRELVNTHEALVINLPTEEKYNEYVADAESYVNYMDGKEDLFTKESWDVFKAAVLAYHEFVAENNHSVRQIEEYKAAADAAYEALVWVAGSVKPNKPNLDMFTSLNKDEYTAESWTPFETALNKVQEICEKDNFTNEELLPAMQELTKAYTELVKLPANKPLQPMKPQFNLGMFEALEEVDYTPETWAPFETALNELKELIKEDAEYDEEAVTEAVNNLLEAYEALETVEISGEEDVDSPNEDDTVAPDEEEAEEGAESYIRAFNALFCLR